MLLFNTGREMPMRMIWCISLIRLPTIGFLKAKMIISITISYTGLLKKNEHIYVGEKKSFSLTFRFSMN